MCIRGACIRWSDCERWYEAPEEDSAKTNYLHHRMCDDIFQEIKKKKKRKKKVTTNTFTLVQSRVHGSTITDVAHLHYAVFCVALAHRWLMQPIECNRCGQTKTWEPDEESFESVFAVLKCNRWQKYNSIYNIQSSVRSSEVSESGQLAHL